MKEKIKENKIFIITVLLIDLFFLVVMALYYYSLTQSSTENNINEQNNTVIESNTQEITVSDNINEKIENNVTTYIKAMITMEEDNYHPLESVKQVENVTTPNLYEDLYSEYSSYEENKGGSGSTGGTSTSVQVKEIYSKQVSSNSYDVIAFAEEVDITNNVSSSTALIFKFNVKVRDKEPLIDEIITEQNFNYGIQGIVEKK